MVKTALASIFVFLSLCFHCLPCQADTVSENVFQLADSIFNDARIVKYKHRHKPALEQIVFQDNNNCSAKTDCSGFISYVLDKAAHRHYEVIRKLEPETPYPQAKTYAQFFSHLDLNSSYKGWIGVKSVFDLKRGDIIAWVQGNSGNNHSSHHNSGHVMMVVDPATSLDNHTVSIYVLDSSSVYHFKPEVLPPTAHQDHRDGLGKGCIRLILNDEGKPIAYWEGSYWGEGNKGIDHPSYTRIISFGRMVHIQNN